MLSKVRYGEGGNRTSIVFDKTKTIKQKQNPHQVSRPSEQETIPKSSQLSPKDRCYQATVIQRIENINDPFRWHVSNLNINCSRHLQGPVVWPFTANSDLQ